MDLFENQLLYFARANALKGQNISARGNALGNEQSEIQGASVSGRTGFASKLKKCRCMRLNDVPLFYRLVNVMANDDQRECFFNVLKWLPHSVQQFYRPIIQGVEEPDQLLMLFYILPECGKCYSLPKHLLRHVFLK